MSSKTQRMKEFLDWMNNKVKSIHVMTNKEFVNILDKM